MNIQIPLSLLPSVLFVVLGIAPVAVVLYLFKKQTEKKKSPLNMALLRSPGESLRIQIQDVSDDILMYALFLPISSLLLYSVFITLLGDN